MTVAAREEDSTLRVRFGFVSWSVEYVYFD